MKERIEALCRLLESEGHMTPAATRQILAVVTETTSAIPKENEQ